MPAGLASAGWMIACWPSSQRTTCSRPDPYSLSPGAGTAPAAVAGSTWSLSSPCPRIVSGVPSAYSSRSGRRFPAQPVCAASGWVPSGGPAAWCSPGACSPGAELAARPVPQRADGLLPAGAPACRACGGGGGDRAVLVRGGARAGSGPSRCGPGPGPRRRRSRDRGTAARPRPAGRAPARSRRFPARPWPDGICRRPAAGRHRAGQACAAGSSWAGCSRTSGWAEI